MKNIRIILIISLLLSFSAFAQSKMIDVKIDSITSDDSNPKRRQFKIAYHIENLTNNDISFFLRPNTLIANAAASLTLFPIYFFATLIQQKINIADEKLFSKTDP